MSGGATAPVANQPQRKEILVSPPSWVSRTKQEVLTSFGDLYQQYRERIYRHLIRLVSDPALAEDLTQEAFLRAYKALPAMQSELKLPAWLYRIATNVALDTLRRRQLVQWQSLDVALDEPAYGMDGDPQEQLGIAETLHAALAQLPTLDRDMLLLFIQQECSYEQLAQASGRSLASVKARLLRARRLLKVHYTALSQS